MIKTAVNIGCFSPQLFAIYYVFAFLFEEKWCQICIRNNKKMLAKRLVLATQIAPKRIAISTKTQCILHQNALHFAPKRSVFSIKTHCILHQNAEKWHKKRRVKGYLWANSRLEMKNGLVAFG